jgi:hypothetical protein
LIIDGFWFFLWEFFLPFFPQEKNNRKKEGKSNIYERGMKMKQQKETKEVKVEMANEKKETARERLLAQLERKARKSFLQDVKAYHRCLYLQATIKELERINEQKQSLEKRLRRLKGSSTSSLLPSTTSTQSTSSMVDFEAIAQAMNGKIKPKELGESERKIYQKVHSYVHCFKSEAWNLETLSPENVNHLEGWKKTTAQQFWGKVRPLM